MPSRGVFRASSRFMAFPFWSRLSFAAPDRWTKSPQGSSRTREVGNRQPASVLPGSGISMRKFDDAPCRDYLPRMSLRPILTLPDPRLKLVSVPIVAITEETRALAADMFETMYEAPGIGLAAIQIGEPVRLMVLDVARKDEERRPMVLVNPDIVWSSPERSVYEEGCLSIPEF